MENITVYMQGIELPAATDGNIIIPHPLLNQVKPWMPLILKLQAIVTDRILITSIITSIDGSPRTGTSHPNGWAIDVTFPDRLNQGVNPHFENDLYLLTYLAARLKGPVMIVAESDHLHIEITDILPGVFRYPTRRPNYYLNDKKVNPRVARDEQLWSVLPTKIALLESENPLVAQRNITKQVLSPQKLLTMTTAVQL